MKGLWKRIVLLGVFAAALFVVGTMHCNRLYASENPGSGWYDIERLAGQQRIGKVVDHEIFFLLTGVDQNQDDPTVTQTRSDTMMLVKVDAKGGSIDLVSLPRDSYVSVKGQMTKLNHAHSIGGIDLLMATISQWLNIDLDYYVQADFGAVVDTVNAIGGVEYTIPDDGITYRYAEDGRWKVLEHGTKTLDGKEALAYLRFRKGYATGDIGRVEAQQKFLQALTQKLFQPKNVTKIPKFAEIAFSNVETNIPWTDIAGMLGSVMNFRNGKLNTYVLPGEGEYIDGISYYITDETATRELVQQVFANYLRGFDPKGDSNEKIQER